MKLTNKKITVITSILYLIAIIAYELFYCNFELFHNISNIYNFSLFRIIFYVAIYSIFLFFKDKFIEETIKSFETKSKRVIFYIFSVIVLFVLFTIIGIIIKYKTYYFWQINMIIACLLIQILVMYITNNIVKNSIVICLTLGIIFSISITVNNQLDEKKHFLSAYSLSLGNISKSKHTVDISLTEINRIISPEQFNKYFSKKPENVLTNTYTSNDECETPAGHYSISYIFDSIGMFLARVFGGSIADIYFAGRIFNLFGYCILVAITLKILPYKKKVFFSVFFMPMLLCLACLHSVDGIVMGLISLFIAYCIKLYEQNDNINIKQIFLLMLLFVLMVIPKCLAYIGISLVGLILPLRKIIKENKKNIWYLIWPVVIILIMLILSTYSSEIHEYGDSRSEGTNSAEQLKFIINNPVAYAKIVINHTVNTFTDVKCLSFLNAPMFFGKTYFNTFIIMIYFILLIGLTDDSKSFNIKVRSIFILTFFLTFIITSTALYISYTSVGANYIDGYQMRYIFPIIPLLLVSISNKKMELNEKNNVNLYVTSAMSFMIIISIVGAIL